MFYLYMDYMFIICYCQIKEQRLSSHMQACGFSPQIYNKLVETKTERQILNLDFVIRIREFPKNKKGKNKAIVLD